MGHLISRTFTLTALIVLPTLAQAHPGHADFGGLAAGLGHPVGGLDHLLAMVAVGLWGAARRRPQSSQNSASS